MSYRVEFTRTVFALPGSLFATASFGGDNNLTTTRDGNERICSSWWLEYVGDKVGIMKHACYMASGCENGYIKPRGKSVQAEGYIRGTREMLKEAVPYDAQCPRTGAFIGGNLTFVVGKDVLENHPEAKVIMALLGGKPVTHYGEEEIHAVVPINEDLAGSIEKLRGLLGKDFLIRGSVSSYRTQYRNDW